MPVPLPPNPAEIIFGPATVGSIWFTLENGGGMFGRSDITIRADGVTICDAARDARTTLLGVAGYATDYDQAYAEASSRRLQLWEESQAEKLRVATDGSTGAGHASERHVFLDGSPPKDAALVAPSLARWVASQFPEEAPILKERRKRREA